MFIKIIPLRAMALASAIIVFTSCSPKEEQDESSLNTAVVKPEDAHVLYDFNKGVVPSALTFDNASASLVGPSEDQALNIAFDSKTNHAASFTFEPESSWDWSTLGDFAFAMDIENGMDISVHLYITATDGSGKTHNRSFVVPQLTDATYYMELKGADLNIETGIRSNPKRWLTDMTPIIWRWGEKNIDLTSIKKISVTVRGLVRDKSLAIDNVRLVNAPTQDTEYLNGLVDEFGQNAKEDYKYKVRSVDALKELSEQEQASLRKTPIEGRSKFGGWLDGPKLDATGFFRVDKHQGKWTLVDPEGYLFFSHGLANVRMANTTTITGYDFDKDTIKWREPGDLTPEDSLGLNQVSAEAVLTRRQESDVRADMFTWLPDYNEPLGKYFGYRRSVHTGAMEHGETYSFYQANLERKFGISDNDALMAQWRETTVDRMLTWGFTSFGNWIDPAYYQMDRIPYFANGWIIGDFQTVSSGNDYWSPLPDPFDPQFETRARITVKTIADEVKNNPWCVGVFVDNEKSWGAMGSFEAQFGIVIHALKMDIAKSSTKAQFKNYLRNKYDTVNALNAVWGTKLTSWSDFDAAVDVAEYTESVEQDFSMLLSLYAEKYFEVVSSSVTEFMPNHLYLGVRFADWGMTPEIRRAAAKYADVVSYNYYKEGIHPEFWSFLEEIDKPSIIGEFHMGATDVGLLNPGLIHAPSQQERARLYTEYMEGVVNNDYLVGAHWFQYIDSPLTGRAYDGENYNVGFVSVTDTPYTEMTDAALQLNSNIYNNRFNRSQNKEP